jgi:hypothetical protein
MKGLDGVEEVKCYEVSQALGFTLSSNLNLISPVKKPPYGGVSFYGAEGETRTPTG